MSLCFSLTLGLSMIYVALCRVSALWLFSFWVRVRVTVCEASRPCSSLSWVSVLGGVRYKCVRSQSVTRVRARRVVGCGD